MFQTKLIKFVKNITNNIGFYDNLASLLMILAVVYLYIGGKCHV